MSFRLMISFRQMISARKPRAHCIQLLHTSSVLMGCSKDQHKRPQRKAYFPFTTTTAFQKQMLHLKCSKYRKEIKHLQEQNLQPRFPVRFSKSRTLFTRTVQPIFTGGTTGLLFNFALEYAIRRGRVNQDGLKLNGTH